MDNNEKSALDAIRELNLSYLVLAQRILRENMAVGMYRLGISRDIAEALVGVSTGQLVKLAAGEQSVCGFRILDASLLTILTQTAKHEQLAPTHAAIVLSAQPSPRAA